MSRRSTFVLLACCAACLLAGAAHADPPTIRQWNFTVFFDGREVGYHRFQLNRSAEGMRLETRAQFAVKFLLLTVFAYDHRNIELWHDDCLAGIESHTDSNGEHYRVTGMTRGGSLLVTNESGEQRLDGCVASFAYWDRRLLEKRRLLNPQTGEYLPVKLESLGPGSLVLGERTIAVQRYALSAEKVDIELAYADGDEWVALDSRLEKGHVLQYRRDPADLSDPPRPALNARLSTE